MAFPHDGKKFKPGESGNPDGKPKGIPNTKTRLQRILNLIEKHKNPVTGDIEDFSVAEILDLQQIIKARKGDSKAYQILVDRLEGKAGQSIDHTTLGKALPTPILGGLAKDVPTDDSNEEDS